MIKCNCIFYKIIQLYRKYLKEVKTEREQKIKFFFQIKTNKYPVCAEKTEKRTQQADVDTHTHTHTNTLGLQSLHSQ